MMHRRAGDAVVRGWWLGHQARVPWRGRWQLIRCFHAGMAHDQVFPIAARLAESAIVARFKIPTQLLMVPPTSAIAVRQPDHAHLDETLGE